MHPVCIQIGEFRIHWFGVMMALGFLAGLVNWTWLGRREERTFNYCSDLLFWIMVSGIVGARFAYVLSDPRSFAQAPLTVFRIDQGGLVYYGGFVGAAIALVLFARAHRESPWSVFDFVVTSVPLAHALGRVGCFLNGCCYGKPLDGWPAVQYPADSLSWGAHVHGQLITRFDAHSLPVHPVQFYESLANLGIYVLLIVTYRRHPGAGITASVYLIAYGIARFCLEFARGDQRIAMWGSLDAAQVVSAVLAVTGIVLVAVRWRATHKPSTGGGT